MSKGLPGSTGVVTLLEHQVRLGLSKCDLLLNAPHAPSSLPCSYGWLLPAGAAGQGRGTRSFVHVTKASALMHDASYLCPLLLRWV